MTLAEYLRVYLDARDEPLRPTSAEKLTSMIWAFEAYHGGTVDLDELSIEMVDAWLAAQLRRGRKPPTVEWYGSMIRTVWRKAHATGLTTAVPPPILRPRKGQPAKPAPRAKAVILEPRTRENIVRAAQLLAEGRTRSQVAHELGVREHCLSDWELRHRPLWDAATTIAMQTMAEAVRQAAGSEVAAELGSYRAAAGVAERWCRRNGQELYPAPPPGEGMTVGAYLEDRYQLARTISAGTADGYRQAVRSLERFVGQRVALSQLNADMVNAWIRSLKVAPTTVSHRRRHLLTLWNAAASEDLCQPPVAGKIRKVRVALSIPVAWSFDEVAALVAAAGRLDSAYPQIGCARAYWWQAAIRVAWDTGLRTGDVLNLAPDVFRGDVRRGIAIQNKTGKPVLIGLHASTARLLEGARHWPQLVWWPYTLEYLRTEFAAVVKAAELRGSFKKLRKSSGSDVEKHHPGWGPSHLGHSYGPKISHAHYFDPNITQTDKPMPTELPA